MNPFLSQEAADSIRSAARKLEYTERETFDVDARFDWNLVFNETNALSLFADKKILNYVLQVVSRVIKVVKHFANSVKTWMRAT